MKDLIKRIVQALVDYPEEVEVVEVDGSTITVMELRVAREDLGKVIGKQGRNVDAIKTILTAAGNKLKKRVVLEIIK